MKRLVDKRKEVEKWKTNICPKILVKLEIEKSKACYCEVLPSTDTLFQVNYYLDSLNVDLEAKTCTCQKWDKSGIPCCHACAAIFFCNQQPENYVDDCYSKATYLKAYSVSIPPLEGEKYWPHSDIKVDPPPIKIGPGRPRKNRRKDPYEDPKKPGKLTKHGSEITCSKCKLKGHNKRGCSKRDDPPNEEPAPKKLRGRPRSAVPRQPTAETAPEHHESIAITSRLGKGGRVILSGRGRGRGRGGNSSTSRGSDSMAGRGRGRSGNVTGRGRGRGADIGTEATVGRGRALSTDVGTTATANRGRGRGRGRGKGGQGKGKHAMPSGFGVLLDNDGQAYTNVSLTLNICTLIHVTIGNLH